MKCIYGLERNKWLCAKAWSGSNFAELDVPESDNDHGSQT